MLLDLKNWLRKTGVFKNGICGSEICYKIFKKGGVTSDISSVFEGIDR
jgi:hypothetical protein